MADGLREEASKEERPALLREPERIERAAIGSKGLRARGVAGLLSEGLVEPESEAVDGNEALLERDLPESVLVRECWSNRAGWSTIGEGRRDVFPVASRLSAWMSIVLRSTRLDSVRLIQL